ncbi:spoIIIJ-associated protein [Thermosyntropha lipolytica DSM 11003]|uniref:RNA-binding protein KhpB n=1 Tax=Thermosyntropha lipolytica DSM 11003 TaxID=1123382 RepID=A0A1M5QRM7_9FIRM|nr:RNA-binding cell elongation regulator Jag/EloR [Thermosyntropha lipolytica]SHH16409.1 spoIIIJ-associated protein [Thermosyntropha lipolytica DSM 11003]
MELQTVEKKGKTIDEAIKAALDELNCSIDDVTVEVLEEPSKGLLGLVKKPALVRVTLKAKPEKEASSLVKEILQKMGLDCQVESAQFSGDTVRINLSGKDMGLVIGHKGETLDALQFIVGLMLNKKREEKIRVVIDVENYRKKKEESLEALALRLSDKVKKTKKQIIMRPMTSQERRIIHTALQGDPLITTYSLGEEPNRKVVIALKK